MVMQRLILIFVLGLLTIPYVHSEDPTQTTAEITTSATNSTEINEGSTTAETNTTDASVTETNAELTTAEPTTIPPTTIPPTTILPTTSEPTTIPPTTVPPTTSEPTTVTPTTAERTTAGQTIILTTSEEIVISTTNIPSQFSTSTIQSTFPTSTDSPSVTSQETTEGSLLPVFECNFTTACFGNGQLGITDGDEFNPTSLSGPPRAPSSDVTSINELTSNNTLCKIPYRPQLDGSTDTTSWDMWFCYKNQCPTENATTATCESGSYGLISLDPSETSKTVNDSVNLNTVLRDLVGNQCLRFFYYFTVYDGMDWGQKLEVWITPNNQSSDRFLVGNFTVSEMQDNRWEFHNITFNSTFSPYILEFNFAVTDANRPTNPATNRTVYFALDNIEVYDYNCEYVAEQLPITTQPPGERATSPTPGKNELNLALILGLTLGLGIPVLLLSVGGVYLFVKRRGNGSDTDGTSDGDGDTDDTSDGEGDTDDTSDGDGDKKIPMKPIRKSSEGYESEASDDSNAF